MFNLTWTLYFINPPKKYFAILFVLSLVARAYLLLYLIVVIYYTINKNNHADFIHLLWVIFLVTTRFLFTILVLSVSLSIPDGPLEITLKNCWNKRNILVNEVFEVVTWKNVKMVLIKSMIPPELSFIYVFLDNPKRRFLLFSVINYIFLGIEWVIFYPFITIYCCLQLRGDFEHDVGYLSFTNLTIAVCGVWMLIFLVYSLYLLIMGVRIKYERMIF